VEGRASVARGAQVFRVQAQGHVHLAGHLEQCPENGQLLRGEAGETVDPHPRPGHAPGSGGQPGGQKAEIVVGVHPAASQVLPEVPAYHGQVVELAGQGRVAAPQSLEALVAFVELLGSYPVGAEFAEGLRELVEESRAPGDGAEYPELVPPAAEQGPEGHHLAHFVYVGAGRPAGLGEDTPREAVEAEDLGPNRGPDARHGDQGPVHLEGGLLGDEQDERSAVGRLPELPGYSLQAVAGLAASGPAEDEAQSQEYASHGRKRVPGPLSP